MQRGISTVFGTNHSLLPGYRKRALFAGYRALLAKCRLPATNSIDECLRLIGDFVCTAVGYTGEGRLWLVRIAL